MEIEFSRGFIKNYQKRFGNNLSVRKKLEERTRLFSANSNNKILHDHPLQGKKISLRSFSITGDIRVIYKILNGIVYFLDIGTHNQVY